MQFDTLTDPIRIEKTRVAVGEHYRSLHLNDRGLSVRYEMPALPEVFPQLRSVIFGSAHRQQYMGAHYYIQSKDRHIQKLVPASEYWNYAFQAIADDCYSLLLKQTCVHERLVAIQVQWNQTKEVMPRTGQPSFVAAGLVYELKTEVASALFFARGLLDTFSTLCHFLYGPSAPKCSSFTDFIKHIKRDRGNGPLDPVMREFIENHLQWFWKLRDFRDYATHHSSLRVSFYSTENQLTTYLEDLIKPEVLIAEIVDGIKAFLAFTDAHYSPRFVARVQL